MPIRPFALPLLFALGCGSCGSEAVTAGDIPVVGAAEITGRLRAFAGKPLLVNLWATWCPPCVKELPALKEVGAAVRAAGGEVIGLNMNLINEGLNLKEESQLVVRFASRRELDFPIWMWSGDDLAGVFAALGTDDPGGVPLTLAIDAAGKVVTTKIGEATLEEFEAMFDAAQGN